MAKSQLERVTSKLAAICFHSGVDSRHTVSAEQLWQIFNSRTFEERGVTPGRGGRYYLCDFSDKGEFSFRPRGKEKLKGLKMSESECNISALHPAWLTASVCCEERRTQVEFHQVKMSAFSGQQDFSFSEH